MLPVFSEKAAVPFTYTKTNFHVRLDKCIRILKFINFFRMQKKTLQSLRRKLKIMCIIHAELITRNQTRTIFILEKELQFPYMCVNNLFTLYSAT